MDDGPWWASWAHAIAVVGFVGITIGSLSQQLRLPQVVTIPFNAAPNEALITLQMNLALTIIWLIMQAVLWLLVASIWGSQTALRGLGIGLIIVHIIGAVGQSGAIAFTRSNSAFEPFNIAPTQQGLSILVDTVNDIGEMSVGQPLDVSITAQAAPDGALAWDLRDFNNLTFVGRSDPTVDSVLVITPADSADPALGSIYVGQDFVIVRRWLPRGLAPAQFFEWLLYRTASVPADEERVILWVRDDVYRLVPGSATP
jgi:hypothetical protein